ncbi:UNVERIFIED_CONTAM: hypothetical protein Sradi_3170200 [Sesamum radiatum]|uniref:Reverse transcriptase domain-containing protein n=1 Tax=Sesamum radiatum TaxID=300843 RepID=A0AAW2RER2_SESRA
MLLSGWRWFDDYSGPGGRIWLAWYAVEVDVEILQVDDQLIHCKVHNKGMHTTCLMSVVYGQCDLIPRRELWARLCMIAETLVDEPWSLLGDFNVVMDTSEICGRTGEPTAAMAEFRAFITASALVHLPFTGCVFSWSNCSEGSRSLWKRLDRILVNEAWLVEWPLSKYISALPSTSGHSPLILAGYEHHRVVGMFRFDNFLAQQPDFKRSVWDVWRHPIHGTRMYAAVAKLKALKSVFQAQRKRKGDLATNVCEAKGFLDKAQSLFDTHKDDVLLRLVKLCQIVYCTAVKQEKCMLLQRSKINWLKDGDQCTKAEFVSFFQSLLGAYTPRRTLDLSFLQSGLKHVINSEEAAALVAPITQQEIKDAFFDISEESAPGPDGYTSAFFKAAWPVIGEDISAAVAEFFHSGQLLRQLNTTLLALIPKVQLPLHVSDFRPIACCNVMYKAITKILVRRLQEVLHLLIDSSQNAFIPGRSIADNVMLAQELLSGYNQKRLPPRCTIKVDIQKAYDSVRWDFLLEGLRIFNFPDRFIGWITQCITTATYSLSLNGSIRGFFRGSRGIRQGDPMSPYLFVIIMELWHVLLQQRIQNSDGFLYHWKCGELGILNLCFADDVLIFCSGTLQSVSIIKNVLSEFASMSGLRVNPNKSQIILSKSVISERQGILDLMGFQEGSLPIKYLGVPLVASRLTVQDCPLLHKVDSRIEGWAQLNLSLAGRTQLIKSVLSSLHVYWASVFILPKSIISAIESRMRLFLWKGSSGSGMAKVSWAQICRPKAEGGLGVRRILLMNQALMISTFGVCCSWIHNPSGCPGFCVIGFGTVRFGNPRVHRLLGAGKNW